MKIIAMDRDIRRSKGYKEIAKEEEDSQSGMVLSNLGVRRVANNLIS